MIYTVAALINEGPGMFRKFDYDKLDHKVTISVCADDVQHALDAAWSIGNRQGADADGNRWPSNVRSLSVADVLIVNGAEREGESWEVVPFGFDKVTAYDVLLGLLYGTKREDLK